jgi:hypothetical protein
MYCVPPIEHILKDEISLTYAQIKNSKLAVILVQIRR